MQDLKTFEYPEYEKVRNFEVIDNDKPIRDTDLVIYRDGSKMDISTSSAFVVFQGHQEIFNSQHKL